MNKPMVAHESRLVRGLVSELAQALGMRLAPIEPEEATAGGLLQPGCAAARLATAKAWIQARQLRDKILDCDMFADPAWDIMLDLYEKYYEGKSVTVTSACLAARVPSATAFRQLSRLATAGWIKRQDDGADRRRVQVSLTRRAIEGMDAVMDVALKNERRLTSAPVPQG